MTAVEWLQYELSKIDQRSLGDYLSLFEKAKQLEKQQSIELIKLASQLTGVATVDNEIGKMTDEDVYNLFIKGGKS